MLCFPLSRKDDFILIKEIKEARYQVKPLFFKIFIYLFFSLKITASLVTFLTGIESLIS